ncbi:MAG: tetratricopeptide repeat protein [Flavobacteriales bacterium]
MTTFFRFLMLFLLISCDKSELTVNKKTAPAQQHFSPKAHYIGMDQCRLCHSDKHETFIHTGMGLSFDEAKKSKSAAHFDENSTLYDPHLNLHYQPHWQQENLMLKELEIDKKTGDTTHLRTQKIDYIIGSGQHTNSHLINEQDYVYQAPFTYYTQDQHLDFPPGFEDGKNSRFSRKIGLECMSCHNAYPDIVLGSENKYNNIPKGIDCERCHGPGSEHLAYIQSDDYIKTKSKSTDKKTNYTTDYKIVNPKTLEKDLQFDLCSRCHLQGNAVLKKDKSFLDFRPGQTLSDVMDVFLPKYSDSDEHFIMASHVDRLKMSACFQGAELTCISCHNPHISVKNTQNKHFNTQCKSCHQDPDHQIIESNSGDCISCHMPMSGSSDIPHVRVTDHNIQIPKTEQKTTTNQAREFLDLYCVNNPNPDELTLIKAYLQQFERFEPLAILLTKAEQKLNKLDLNLETFKLWVHLNYLKSDANTSIELLGKLTGDWQSKLKTSYDNQDAWFCYRLAKNYLVFKNIEQSKVWYSKSLELAPLMLDIRLSFAKDLIDFQQFDLAKSHLEFIQNEQESYEGYHTPLAYILAQKGEFQKAKILYRQAIALNPNELQAQVNLAGLLVVEGKVKEAKKYLINVLEKEKTHQMANMMWNALEER